MGHESHEATGSFARLPRLDQIDPSVLSEDYLRPRLQTYSKRKRDSAPALETAVSNSMGTSQQSLLPEDGPSVPRGTAKERYLIRTKGPAAMSAERTQKESQIVSDAAEKLLGHLNPDQEIQRLLKKEADYYEAFTTVSAYAMFVGKKRFRGHRHAEELFAKLEEHPPHRSKECTVRKSFGDASTSITCNCAACGTARYRMCLAVEGAVDERRRLAKLKAGSANSAKQEQPMQPDITARDKILEALEKYLQTESSCNLHREASSPLGDDAAPEKGSGSLLKVRRPTGAAALHLESPGQRRNKASRAESREPAHIIDVPSDDPVQPAVLQPERHRSSEQVEQLNAAAECPDDVRDVNTSGGNAHDQEQKPAGNHDEDRMEVDSRSASEEGKESSKDQQRDAGHSSHGVDTLAHGTQPPSSRNCWQSKKPAPKVIDIRDMMDTVDDVAPSPDQQQRSERRLWSPRQSRLSAGGAEREEVAEHPRLKLWLGKPARDARHASNGTMRPLERSRRVSKLPSAAAPDTHLQVKAKHRPPVALRIKKHWCEEIFEGTKVWEIRGSALRKQGRVCIAQSKSNHLVGEVTFVNCLKVGKLVDGELVPWSDSAEDRQNFIGEETNLTKHCIEDLEWVQYPRVFAWVMEKRERYPEPVEYANKVGPVNWVRLDWSQSKPAVKAREHPKDPGTAKEPQRRRRRPSHVFQELRPPKKQPIIDDDDSDPGGAQA